MRDFTIVFRGIELASNRIGLNGSDQIALLLPKQLFNGRAIPSVRTDSSRIDLPSGEDTTIIAALNPWRSPRDRPPT